ncbi:AAA family ATPase [Desulfomonile tiedjei]|uniref:AAA family ATPase n=1 Tax=Desulfomonile tiedjei TaxID=2358 RepID=UPI0002DA8558|nr:AAA family ATPase [Desulfomonile tiedjei]
MKQIAVYGKGGIGKSTITTNLSVCLAASGHKVLQIGCDPKHDSTRMLNHGSLQPTVLDTLRESGPAGINRDDIVRTGYGGVLTIEAGGPEPGIGCAGRGIISMFEILEKLEVITDDKERDSRKEHPREATGHLDENTILWFLPSERRSNAVPRFNMTTVYLASPLGFSPELKSYRDRIKARLKEIGCVIFDPWEQAFGAMVTEAKSITNWTAVSRYSPRWPQISAA